MSAQHKRPLLAFVVVGLLCALSLGHAIRSEAVVGLFRAALPALSQPDAPLQRDPARVSAKVEPARDGSQRAAPSDKDGERGALGLQPQGASAGPAKGVRTAQSVVVGGRATAKSAKPRVSSAPRPDPEVVVPVSSTVVESTAPGHSARTRAGRPGRGRGHSQEAGEPRESHGKHGRGHSREAGEPRGSHGKHGRGHSRDDDGPGARGSISGRASEHPVVTTPTAPTVRESGAPGLAGGQRAVPPATSQGSGGPAHAASGPAHAASGPAHAQGAPGHAEDGPGRRGR
ncbi:hypothetical protein [Nocardioides houyundeii]|uniref:hypothetical protein n=1 Tax=Nocardioides houyundeii TaxID=2045452 RepID=UPI000DF4026A|nr:hypothetical protein [Nocardioides houyundeii]